ncbi:unnamed protein product [Phyllotreta striolata]|uniref:LysM domain-containing protein n=1 Tax=Phyllotreta striolata TaxID=444603 RepID=A0A9N9TP58_PHYSR|nr:unnamed protein product [Phyllotreta striolata]
MVKHRPKKKYDYKNLNGKDNGSDSGEETELFVVNKPQRIEFPTIDKAVEEGDTLQAIAIKYHCSVAQLKRINNFLNENEIFAKRVIKVPHRPFTSALASVHISGDSSPDVNEAVSTSNLIDIESLSSKLTETLNTPKEENQVNEIIFNSQIIPNQVSVTNPRVPEASCDERTNLLVEDVGTSTESDPVISLISCNGADADISWKVLLACIVIVIVALPVVYVFYIAEHPESYHHHHHTS